MDSFHSDFTMPIAQMRRRRMVCSKNENNQHFLLFFRHSDSPFKIAPFYIFDQFSRFPKKIVLFLVSLRAFLLRYFDLHLKEIVKS